jgi:hypothetical protein
MVITGLTVVIVMSFFLHCSNILTCRNCFHGSWTSDPGLGLLPVDRVSVLHGVVIVVLYTFIVTLDITD